MISANELQYDLRKSSAKVYELCLEYWGEGEGTLIQMNHTTVNDFAFGYNACSPQTMYKHVSTGSSKSQKQPWKHFPPLPLIFLARLLHLGVQLEMNYVSYALLIRFTRNFLMIWLQKEGLNISNMFLI